MPRKYLNEAKKEDPDPSEFKENTVQSNEMKSRMSSLPNSRSLFGNQQKEINVSLINPILPSRKQPFNYLMEFSKMNMISIYFTARLVLIFFVLSMFQLRNLVLQTSKLIKKIILFVIEASAMSGVVVLRLTNRSNMVSAPNDTTENLGFNVIHMLFWDEAAISFNENLTDLAVPVGMVTVESYLDLTSLQRQPTKNTYEKLLSRLPVPYDNAIREIFKQDGTEVKDVITPIFNKSNDEKLAPSVIMEDPPPLKAPDTRSSHHFPFHRNKKNTAKTYNAYLDALEDQDTIIVTKEMQDPNLGDITIDSLEVNSPLEKISDQLIAHKELQANRIRYGSIAKDSSYFNKFELPQTPPLAPESLPEETPASKKFNKMLKYGFHNTAK